jgi:NTP pyrophosphatase (non-canonical NTP hydrolase)
MNESRTMKDMQQEVNRYISQFKEGYFPPMEMLARLTEELGELSREVQHVHGTKKKKPGEAEKSLEEETGDLFFVLVCFANANGIDLDRALAGVMEKFNRRDSGRWTKIGEE